MHESVEDQTAHRQDSAQLQEGTPLLIVVIAVNTISIIDTFLCYCYTTNTILTITTIVKHDLLQLFWFNFMWPKAYIPNTRYRGAWESKTIPQHP